MNNTRRMFQRKFHIKTTELKLSRGFFSLVFFRLQKKRNLFLPSSLNWMQFIASPKLIFHWLAGSMGHGRQCVSARLPMASGANMWKLARGYGVRPIEEEAERQRGESIRNRWGGGSRRGEKEEEQKIKAERKRQKAVCLPADIWVLSADWKSSGISEKENRVI